MATMAECILVKLDIFDSSGAGTVPGGFMKKIFQPMPREFLRGYFLRIQSGVL